MGVRAMRRAEKLSGPPNSPSESPPLAERNFEEAPQCHEHIRTNFPPTTMCRRKS